MLQDSISLSSKENKNSHAEGGCEVQIEELVTIIYIKHTLLKYTQRIIKDRVLNIRREQIKEIVNSRSIKKAISTYRQKKHWEYTTILWPEVDEKTLGSQETLIRESELLVRIKNKKVQNLCDETFWFPLTLALIERF